MTIERTIHGSYICSDIVNGYLVKHMYYGYTLKEVKTMFRKKCKEAAMA